LACNSFWLALTPSFVEALAIHVTVPPVFLIPCVFPPSTTFFVLKAKNHSSKHGHRRVDPVTGEVSFKKVRSSDLMHAIQMGLRQSIGTVQPIDRLLAPGFSPKP
jgi:hypothetical protein